MSINPNLPFLAAPSIQASFDGHRGIQAAGAGAPAGARAAIDQMQADLSEVVQVMSQVKQHQDERIDQLAAHVDEVNRQQVALSLGSLDPATRGPVDAGYTRDFQAWISSGDRDNELRVKNSTGRLGAIRASMSEGTSSAGGYLAPVEWDRTIAAAQLPTSPMRRIATVMQSGVRGFSTIWNNNSWGSGWVGETAARPETGTPTFSQITFSAGQIYANAAITQDLLEDADMDLSQFIQTEIGAEFGRQEATAFVSGNGTNKPNGFLTYATGGTNAATHPGGALDVVTVAGAAAFTVDELIGFAYGLAAPYRQNARWLMNSTTAAILAKMKDADNNLIWRESLAAAQPATLLGYPVEFDENMPAIAVSALPIAFGDFKAGYLINDRLGVSVLRDPYTNKPYVMFYARKRVGGGVRDPRAIRVLKMAAS